MLSQPAIALGSVGLKWRLTSHRKFRLAHSCRLNSLPDRVRPLTRQQCHRGARDSLYHRSLRHHQVAASVLRPLTGDSQTLIMSTRASILLARRHLATSRHRSKTSRRTPSNLPAFLNSPSPSQDKTAILVQSHRKPARASHRLLQRAHPRRESRSQSRTQLLPKTGHARITISRTTNR